MTYGRPKMMKIARERTMLHIRSRPAVARIAHRGLQNFLLHVLPSGFVKIRHYGLLAAGNATTQLERAPMPPTEPPQRTLLQPGMSVETPVPRGSGALDWPTPPSDRSRPATAAASSSPHLLADSAFEATPRVAISVEQGSPVHIILRRLAADGLQRGCRLLPAAWQERRSIRREDTPPRLPPHSDSIEGNQECHQSGDADGWPKGAKDA